MSTEIETSESELIQTEPNTPEVTAADGEVETKQQAEPEQKTFTQAEVDALIQKRLLKEERRVHRRIEQQMREAQQQQVRQQPIVREAFQDDEAYLKAQIKQLAEQEADKIVAERQARQEAERRIESIQQKVEKAAERYPDFQAVVSNPTLPINEVMVEFIAESDQGAEVAYFLGKNPGKAYEISQMSPVRAGRELAKIEADLASRPARVSRAPEPINPVGNRGRASSSSLPSDDDDIETWMRKERARAAQR